MNAAQATKCFRCGTQGTSGKNFTGVCGARLDTHRNPLVYRTMFASSEGAPSGRLFGFGPHEGGLRGLRGSTLDWRSLSIEEVKAVIASEVQAHGVDALRASDV